MNSLSSSAVLITPKSLCIVVAFFLVTSCNLLAAFPVGAHIEILNPVCSKIETTAFKIVVFPVPGPPVKIKFNF